MAKACIIVINILPVKPFETILVIKGYTNKIKVQFGSGLIHLVPWSQDIDTTQDETFS